MTRRDRQRLEDILAAIDAIAKHLQRGDLHDGLVFDAVRARLIEVGEAVKALSPDLLGTEPDMPWARCGSTLTVSRNKRASPWPSGSTVGSIAGSISPLDRAPARIGEHRKCLVSAWFECPETGTVRQPPQP